MPHCKNLRLAPSHTAAWKEEALATPPSAVSPKLVAVGTKKLPYHSAAVTNERSPLSTAIPAPSQLNL